MVSSDFRRSSFEFGAVERESLSHKRSILRTERFHAISNSTFISNSGGDYIKI